MAGMEIDVLGWLSSRKNPQPVAAGDALPGRSTPVLDSIRTTGRLSDDDEAALRAAVESFRSTYLAGGKMLSGEVAAAEEEAPAEHTAEQIVLKRS